MKFKTLMALLVGVCVGWGYQLMGLDHAQYSKEEAVLFCVSTTVYGLRQQGAPDEFIRREIPDIVEYCAVSLEVFDDRDQ